MVTKKERKRKTVIGVLAAVVVVVTASWLALPAITADDPHCGIEDPTHEHMLACYSDATADIETQEEWEATLPAELTGDVAADVALVAESQLGYEESTANYQVTDGDVQKGYTRYGAWYGDFYCDWNVPFAAFCLEYGGASYDLMPESEDCSAWMDQLDNTGYFAMAGSDYVPVQGDLMFVSGDGVRAGVLTAISEDGSKLTVIEGDSDDSVRKVIYDADSTDIVGYGVIAGSTEAVSGDEEEQEPAEKEQAKTMDLTPRAASSVLTYSDSEKTGSFEPVNNSNYPASSYKLKVEKLSASNYKDKVEKFMGVTPDEYVAYKIALVETRNNSNQEVQNYNGGYKVELTFSKGVFASSDTSDYFYMLFEYDGAQYEVKPTTIERNDAGNVVRLVFEGSDRYPRQNEFMLIRHSEPRIIKAGQRVVKYNTVKDAFITDPAYAKYYNENSPIGTAGSFHIVAFGTADLQTHTNGNILAHTLEATSANFGTNNYVDELTYAQNYTVINSNSASKENHVLVLGSSNNITLVDNNNGVAVNGIKIDKPYNFVCDIDTATNPFIDLERVENEVKNIASELKAFADGGVTETNTSQYDVIKLNKPSGIGVVHYTAAELGAMKGEIRMDGFSAGVMGTIIVNVDCAGAKTINMPTAYVYVDGEKQNTSEVVEFSAGKVIWNFLNAEGVTINTQMMTGMVVAPGATVNITKNLNGTVVAENVNVQAESHRTDFTGTLVEAVDDGVVVKKIKTGYVGTALSGAVFDLYKWENNAWVKKSSSLRTGTGGYLQLGTLEASVAYKLVETKAPSGYVINPEPTYFWVRTDKNQTSPNKKPGDFSGSAVEVGGMLLVANEPGAGDAVTKLDMQITKQWHNSSGNPMDEPPVDSIEVKIFRTANNDESTRTVWDTVTLNEDSGWTAVIADAPVSETNSNGVSTVYTYEASEINVPEGFEVTCTSAQDDDSIDLTVINTRVPGGYELPDAGGIGTRIFTITGALLMLLAIAVLYRRRNG